MLDDLDALVGLVRQQEPGRALFLYGHSFGGLAAALYTIERQPSFAGLVLASPLLALDAPPFLGAAVRVVDVVAPDLPTLGLDHAGFSSRPEVVDEMNRDPLISQVKAPARTARSVFDAAERVWAAPQRLRVPLLIVHGTADALTAAVGSRDLVARAGTPDRTLRLYDGGKHDLLREPDGAGERTAGEVIAWLDAHAGGPAVTFASSRPAGHLRGDQRGHVLSVELDGRGERGDPDRLDASGGTAGLRLRVGLGAATPLRLGYFGGLDLRGGYLDGGVYEADAHVVGLAIRTRGGAMLSLTGGIGVGGLRGAAATHAPAELGLEIPAGPVRLLARGSLGWRLGGDAYADDALGLADEVSALAGVRLGAEHRYWTELSAGAGPFLALSYRNLGGVELLGVALGLELWAGN